MKKYILSTLSRHKFPLIVTLGVWGTYFSFLFFRLIAMRPNGLWVGHVYVWSDWALHISLANMFANKTPGLWFMYHPLYAGGKATYPFITDAISGFLMRFGMSLEYSFIIPSVLFAISLTIGLYFLGYLLLQKKIPAVISVFIFYLTPSLGFINYIRDIFTNQSFLKVIYPAIEYGRFDKYNWFSGNVITGLLGPQRTFLLGMTITVWIIIGLIYSISRENLKNQTRQYILIICGFFAGLLPIIHPHSFIFLIIVSICLSLFYIKKWKQIIWFAIPSTLLSSILFYIFIHGGIENTSFFSWHPGWSVNDKPNNWLTMWLWISGTSIPLAILGWLKIRKKYSHAFFTSIFLTFIVSNLFLFQPIDWDNSKLFFWTFLGFAYLASNFIYYLWGKRGCIMKIISAILLISLIFTGILETVRLQNVRANGHIITSTEDIILGKQISQVADQYSIFLTAPTHNHFVMVWGLRPILMGFVAWIWNYGFLYQEREIDLRKMYKGGEDAENLLRKYKISYVVIGPVEKSDLYANEHYFSSRFPIAFKNSSNKIYDVRGLWK